MQKISKLFNSFHKNVLGGLGHFMSKNFSVVILDGIYTTQELIWHRVVLMRKSLGSLILIDLIGVFSSRSFLAGNKSHFPPNTEPLIDGIQTIPRFINTVRMIN